MYYDPDTDRAWIKVSLAILLIPTVIVVAFIVVVELLIGG